MIKLSIILTFLLGGALWASSQTYFNTLLENPNVEGATGVVNVDDTLFVASVQQGTFDQRLLIHKIDLNGNQLNEFVISDTSALFLGYKGIFSHDNHLIVYGAQRINDSLRPMICKIDLLGNVIWKKSYSIFSASDFSILYNGILGNGDSSYVFCGTQNFGSGNYQGVYLKTDTLGNILNQGFSGAPQYDLLSAITKGVGNGYLCSGYQEDAQGKENIYLLKLDESMGVQWSKTHTNPLGISTGHVNNIYDSYWLGGTWAKTNEYTSIAMKISETGNILDSVTISPTDEYYSTFSAKPILGGDGLIALVGSASVISSQKPQGWIAKIDTNCNVIWKRRYNTDRTNDHYLTDIVQVRNKGIIACGYAFPDLGLTQDSWLIGIDSLGCDSLNCLWLGNKELYTSELTIYPSPTSDIVNFPVNINLFDFDIGVFNELGQLFTPQYEQRRIFVESLPAGIYFIRLMRKNKVILTKFLKQ